jgi:hypothetical protein
MLTYAHVCMLTYADVCPDVYIWPSQVYFEAQSLIKKQHAQLNADASITHTDVSITHTDASITHTDAPLLRPSAESQQKATRATLKLETNAINAE